MGKIISGYADDPAKAYLVVDGTRHWIASHDIFQQCGLGAVEQASSAERDGKPILEARDFAALRHLRGKGIEIGALHKPSLLPSGASALYVDYISSDEARERYPELGEVTDKIIVDDGETLDKFAPGSLDFVVANHFLEHARNPLGVIRTHLSKLRDGGVLLYALPDKRYSFDRDRPVTPFAHLVMDDQHGPDLSDRSHYLEYVRFVDKLTTPSEIEAHASILKDMDNRIHFHVWDAEAIRQLFEAASEYLGGFAVVQTIESGFEVITVLQKH